MGKGDIKTKRGKLSNRSYGVLRPKKRKSNSPAEGLKEEKKAKTKKK